MVEEDPKKRTQVKQLLQLREDLKTPTSRYGSST